MENIEAVSGFSIKCRGAYLKHQLNESTDVTITVYENGDREVGCPYLSRGSGGICLASELPHELSCVHFLPQRNHSTDLNPAELKPTFEEVTRPLREDHTPFLGDVVKALRNQLNWSPSDLAKKSGVNLSAISRLEHNKIKSPRIANLIKLSKALGVSIENLLEGSLPSAQDTLSLTD